jgi:micrococcal nuclease
MRDVKTYKTLNKWLYRGDPAFDEKHLFNYRIREIVKIVDGDTFACHMDMGKNLIKEDVRVRLFGVQCPETFRAKDQEEFVRGKAAKEFAEDKINNTLKPMIFQSFRDKDDSFGRWLGIVYYFDKNGWQNLNLKLLKSGHATLYKG